MTHRLMEETIARNALSGVTTWLERSAPGVKIINCDIADDDWSTVLIELADGRKFKFTVTVDDTR